MGYLFYIRHIPCNRKFRTSRRDLGSSPRVRKACEWLLEKQMEDGGWGEHYTSCGTREYVQHEKSQVVNTSWALLALMRARYPDRTPIERGLRVSIPDYHCFTRFSANNNVTFCS